MRAFWAMFRIRARRETQYRVAALAGLTTQVFFGMVYILVYQTLYQTGAAADPLQNTVSYVWMQQAFLILTMSFSDSEVSQMIINGNIGYELVRPIGIYTHLFARTLGRKLVATLMRSIPILLFSFCLPEAYRLSGPASAQALGAFGISLALGLLVSVALDMFPHLIALYTLDARGAATILPFVSMMFNGNIVPLTLFPDGWQRWMRLQPFAQILDSPIRLYLGEQPVASLPLLAGVQCLWLGLFVALGVLLWRRGTKRLVLQGG